MLLPQTTELPMRVAVGAKTRELTELLFKPRDEPGAKTGLAGRSHPLHRFAQESGRGEGQPCSSNHGADLNARDDDICSTPLG